mmetsp:Transcript_30953/g.90205  ORF Transcript_30953/g.90205 Transcript_30953/m.90205 type:complete len:357 (+) Transcript_30953:68-1138(+)
MTSPPLPRVLVTGGQGFLGAYALRWLLRRGSSVALLDKTENLGILQQVLEAEEIGKVTRLYGDIADADVVTEHILTFKPSAVIHLAAVQIPTVAGNPILGANINVVGTVNVFQAVKKLAEQERAETIPVVYASSAAVLGPSSDYAAGGPLPAERDYHRPRTLYGVFKLCNEGTARIFWQDHHIPSVGLRPLTVFGVGREVGLTSGPTKAVKAAVLGRRYQVEVTGTTAFTYVDDTARLFVDAAQAVAAPDRRGAHVCGIKGHLVSYEDFLAEAALSVPEVSQLVSIRPGAPEVPIHGDVDEAPLQLLLGRRDLHRPLAEAIADMAAMFKKLHQRGALHDKDLGVEPPPSQGPGSKL